MKYDYIIIVDDNPTTIFYNTDVAKDFSPESKLLSFQNPIDFLKEFDSIMLPNKPKCLLLLDISMPEIRGFEMMEELEENNEMFSDIDVLIVSSSNLKSDQEKATRFVNVVGYIEKPISVEKLKNALQGTT
jgi:CheY-like chemotaxis protein